MLPRHAEGDTHHSSLSWVKPDKKPDGASPTPTPTPRSPQFVRILRRQVCQSTVLCPPPRSLVRVQVRGVVPEKLPAYQHTGLVE